MIDMLLKKKQNSNNLSAVQLVCSSCLQQTVHGCKFVQFSSETYQCCPSRFHRRHGTTTPLHCTVLFRPPLTPSSCLAPSGLHRHPSGLHRQQQKQLQTIDSARTAPSYRLQTTYSTTHIQPPTSAPISSYFITQEWRAYQNTLLKRHASLIVSGGFRF